MADNGAGLADDLRVGHKVERVIVTGSFQGEPRQVDVHLWYPADRRGLSELPKAVYTSALHETLKASQTAGPAGPVGPLDLDRRGRDRARRRGDRSERQAFPVIVFSHGSVNDPIDYAHTLELIAGAGFVVAAPRTSTTRRTTSGSTTSTVKPAACRTLRCSRATTGGPGPARGQTFRSAWPTGSGTSRKSSTSSPSGSETGSTRRGWASSGTPGNRDRTRRGRRQRPMEPRRELPNRRTSPVPRWASGFPLTSPEAEPRVKAIMGMAIAARAHHPRREARERHGSGATGRRRARPGVPAGGQQVRLQADREHREGVRLDR